MVLAAGGTGTAGVFFLAAWPLGLGNEVKALCLPRKAGEKKEKS